MSEKAPLSEKSPKYQRCQNPLAMEEVLRRYAFGVPLPFLPPAFFRTVVREVFAVSPQVYVVTAEVNGECCGFALGQTMGPTMWRKIARNYVGRHPFAVAWLVLRLKIVMPLQWHSRRWWNRIRSRGKNPKTWPNPGVPRRDEPFRWTGWEHDSGEVGQVDQVFVADSHRNRGIASGLLRFLTEEMERSGVRLIEAHVDETNLPSLTAFRKAGWEAYQMAGNDFHVCHQAACGSLEHQCDAFAADTECAPVGRQNA